MNGAPAGSRLFVEMFSRRVSNNWENKIPSVILSDVSDVSFSFFLVLYSLPQRSRVRLKKTFFSHSGWQAIACLCVFFLSTRRKSDGIGEGLWVRESTHHRRICYTKILQLILFFCRMLSNLQDMTPINSRKQESCSRLGKLLCALVCSTLSSVYVV